MEALEPSGQVVVGGVERRVVVGRHRVGDGPVQASERWGQLLVGEVADRDDEVVRGQHLLGEAGGRGVDDEAVAPGGGDRTGVDAVGRVRTGGDGRHGAAPAVVPLGGGQLGAGRVAGADEGEAPGVGPRLAPGGDEPGDDGVGRQREVVTPPVALRPQPAHHARCEERADVVGHQVAGHAEHVRELLR